MLRLAALALALAGGLAACHEQFDAVPTPDLAKIPETFGFDLSGGVDMARDMSAEPHPDLSQRDGA